MNKPPKYNPNPWHPSIEEDFRRAKNDDERRRIIEACGYNDKHKGWVDRHYSLAEDAPPPRKTRKKPKRITIEKALDIFSKLWSIIADCDAATGVFRAAALFIWRLIRSLF